MTATTRAAADAAGTAIPPLWPLAATVAVNPFLGHASEPLATTAARLARAGVAATPSPEHVATQIASGAITAPDLAAALAAAGRPADVDRLVSVATRSTDAPARIATVVDLAAGVTGRDWPGVVAERFGHWAAAYLDAGQALWAAPRAASAWTAWRATATHDLTPEIMGLTGFATFVAGCPDTADAAIERAVATLGVPAAALEAYFHRLLMSLGGWAQAARQREWVAAQHGGSDDLLRACLAVRLLWEEALFRHCGAAVASGWADALAAYAAPLAPTEATSAAAIVQDAADRAAQRRLAAILAAPPAAARRAPQPWVQAAFCIDVRSEVFRRALEAADPGIATIGFAGFFGLGVGHHRMASDVLEARLPVLLTPGIATRATAPAATDVTARLAARTTRAWDRFKLAAVSSFAFVEAAGPAYVVKLVRDALAIGHPVVPDPAPQPEPPLPLATRAATAEAVLRAMSLTRDFAPLVLIAGHGAGVVNNPHASALHCGACGGYPGDVNARLLAALLNAGDVRDHLAARGIAVPPATRFVAGLHDTTSDTVALFAGDAAIDPAALDRLRRVLDAAGAAARAERARRLPRGGDGRRLARRGGDWGEVRPEWGLAGCSAFIAAPRARTIGRDLGGRVFLHDYAWADDDGFATLELILTAPVVVASWISLQYYGSVVAPEAFGAGNKLLHNVVGGIGVLEGNGGLLRSGLPWQSVSDGHGVVHDPVRLTVMVEAPREAIDAVLAKHAAVRALFDNRWLHLLVIDDGDLAWRYAGGAWEREPDASRNTAPIG